MIPENAKVLANLFCFYRGANAEFAKKILGTWLYTDAIVVHNLLATGFDDHLQLFRKKLAEDNIEIKEFARCDCRECWVVVLKGSKVHAHIARQLAWECAFQVANLPITPLNEIDHAIEPPDFPTIDEHVAFIKQLQKHGLIKCGRMTYEGQHRTKM